MFKNINVKLLIIVLDFEFFYIIKVRIFEIINVLFFGEF